MMWYNTDNWGNNNYASLLFGTFPSIFYSFIKLLSENKIGRISYIIFNLFIYDFIV